ncbi:MAG: OmpA family protein [Oxalobacter sp.]|nr:MAG: OmpA family protein [Oxalobacter sp.]
MKTKYLAPAVLIIAALLGGCSSMPSNTTLLQQTRNDYVAAQSNPDVAKYAQLEMKQAGDALALANEAAKDNRDDQKIDELAYIAKQKISVAQEVAKRKSFESEVAKAAEARTLVRLNQRTNEANQARASAEQSKMETQIAQSETATERARADNLESQLVALSAIKTQRGMVITLQGVLFSTDQARLNANGMGTVQKIAYILEQNPQRNVLIEGFADSTGSAAYNKKLSKRRAATVRNALLELGVASERMSIRAYGESYPVASNDTAQSRQLNRRVEIVFSDASGKILPR